MYKGLYLLACLYAGGPVVAQSATAEITYVSCAVCHGDGEGRNAIPEIRGLPQDALLTSLNGFAKDAEGATIMHRFLVALTSPEIEDLARHVSGLKGRSR